MTTLALAGDDDFDDIERMLETYTPDAKAEVLKRLREKKSRSKRVWYCKQELVDGQLMYGRECDGEPHGVVDYAHARKDQWPPLIRPGWLTWMLLGGRGSGKTRSGSEFTRVMSKHVGRMGLIAPTTGDVRDTMIEGDSGLIKVCEAAGEKVEWYPSKRRLMFANGCIAGTFSGEEPDRLRGPQHGYFWADEPSHYPLIDDIWDMMLLGLRLGLDPKVCITSTPLPNDWTKERLADPTTIPSKVSTYANLRNLAPTFRDAVLSRFEGTRLGRQELYGELLDDVEGAAWSNDLIIHRDVSRADLDRVVIGIDPAGTANRRSDQTGLIAMGRKGNLGHVLADSSGKYSPDGWARAAMHMYEIWDADAIVVEHNFGGDMVESNLRNSGFTGRIKVKRAMRSKWLRAEPLIGMYEQRRITHAPFGLEKLENEQTTWIPGEGDSPNRVDALVWASEELFGTAGPTRFFRPRGGPMVPSLPGSTFSHNRNPLGRSIFDA